MENAWTSLELCIQKYLTNFFNYIAAVQHSQYTAVKSPWKLCFQFEVQKLFITTHYYSSKHNSSERKLLLIIIKVIIKDPPQTCLRHLKTRKTLGLIKWQLRLLLPSRIYEYANVVHFENLTQQNNMSPSSQKSPFSVYVHRRLQVSTLHWCMLHIGPN